MNEASVSRDTVTSAALHCLQGGPPPAEVVSDWARFGALHPRALGALWDLVEASLATVDPALERRAEAFCQLYETPAEDLRASLRVCRYLLGRAASVDLSRDRFADDLRVLGGVSAGGELLLSHFEAAKAKLRGALLEQAITTHGKVLAGVDVRVDRILGSDKVGALDAPVALLTLRLHEHEKPERVTFYATPDGVAHLREVLVRAEALLAQARVGR